MEMSELVGTMPVQFDEGSFYFHWRVYSPFFLTDASGATLGPSGGAGAWLGADTQVEGSFAVCIGD